MYIYIYILVIISLVIFILPPLISRRLPVSTTSKWKTRLRERMRRVSFRLTEGRGGATFNQGCVISDPSSTRSTFQRSLQRSCSEKFGLDVSISRIHICVCVKINFDFASPSRRRGGDAILYSCKIEKRGIVACERFESSSFIVRAHYVNCRCFACKIITGTSGHRTFNN